VFLGRVDCADCLRGCLTFRCEEGTTCTYIGEDDEETVEYISCFWAHLMLAEVEINRFCVVHSVEHPVRGL